MATEQSAGPIVGSGTAEGLFAFLDFLVEKGYGTKNAVTPWKSAARQVLAAVEGNAYEKVDVRSIDPDEYMDRFENMTVGQYKTESLASYRSRFKKAIQGYKGYLSDRQIPNFRGGGSGGSRRVASPSPTKPQAQQRPALQPAPRELEVGDELVDYPFPLQSGQMVHLYLPSKLAKPDADRLGAFLQTLVLEPQRQIAARTEP
jgi:hypothetical protein